MKKNLKTSEVFRDFKFSQAEFDKDEKIADYPFVQKVVNSALQKYKGKGLLMIDKLNIEDIVPDLEYTHIKKKIIDLKALDSRNKKLKELEERKYKSLNREKKKEFYR